jgi:hypothetical protein
VSLGDENSTCFCCIRNANTVTRKFANTRWTGSIPPRLLQDLGLGRFDTVKKIYPTYVLTLLEPSWFLLRGDEKHQKMQVDDTETKATIIILDIKFHHLRG